MKISKLSQTDLKKLLFSLSLAFAIPATAFAAGTGGQTCKNDVCCNGGVNGTCCFTTAGHLCPQQQ